LFSEHCDIGILPVSQAVQIQTKKIRIEIAISELYVLQRGIKGSVYR